MLARRLEQCREEGGGAAQLIVGLQPFEVEHDRRAVLACPCGEPLDLDQAVVRRIHRDMVEGIGERDEIALGIDDDLLDEPRAPFEQAAQQMRFARPRIALDEQARGQQLFEVNLDRTARSIESHVDLGSHYRADGNARGAGQADCVARPGSKRCRARGPRVNGSRYAAETRCPASPRRAT